MIIDLVLKGKQVIVFGAGREASRKVDGLLTQDCRIIVIAENIHENIRHFAKLGKLDLEKCRIPNGDYLEKWEDPFLVIAGTDDRNLNRKIVDAARRRRCYAYALDDPEYSDFSHPAVINFADTLQVALSTGGRSPLMARRLKEQGPGIAHVAWGVTGINSIFQDLKIKGNDMRGDAPTSSPFGYKTLTIKPSSSHGIYFQLAEGEVP